MKQTRQAVLSVKQSRFLDVYGWSPLSYGYSEAIGKMEQYALKYVNNCLNTNIYSYLGKSGGQSSNLYLNVLRLFNPSVN